MVLKFGTMDILLLKRISKNKINGIMSFFYLDL